jgi:hypothetical protein
VHIPRLEKARNSGLFDGSIESKACRSVSRATSLSRVRRARECAGGPRQSQSTLPA